MIDTRTGINQWGAFPLLGFADQIVLVAYPNEENVEGLTNIIELMQKAGLDNYVVAMSKFEEDDRGVNIAKQYFDRFKDIKQEFLGIGYMSSSDMIGKYPFLDNLEPYKALSDYISESEIVKFNIKFLSKVNVVEILKQIKNCFINADGIVADKIVKGDTTEDKTLKTDISSLKKEQQKEELREEDISMLVMDLLDSSIFNEYIEAMLENGEIFKCLSNVSNNAQKKDINENINGEVNEDAQEQDHIIRQKILDLFWGIRVSPKRYCKPVSFWFYNELKNICESTKVKTSQNNTCTVNKSMVIKILNKALEIEIDKRRQPKEEVKGTKTANFADINADAVNDRLLSTESIFSACTWYASNESI